MKTMLFSAILFLFISEFGIALDDSPPVLIYVMHEGDDVEGAKLAFKIKEIIRESASFKISDKTEGSLILNICTLNYKDESGNLTFYSASWEGETRGPFRVKYEEVIGYFGNSKTSDTAEYLVANTSKVAETLAEIVNMWKE